MKPYSAIECGCGDFSTPLLRTYIHQLVTIEHDNRWAKLVQDQCPASPQHLWLVKPLEGGIKNPTAAADLLPAQREAITSIYKERAQELAPYDLLFMDTFRAGRVSAVKELLPKAKMLVLHDVEGPSYDYYQFGELEEILKGLHRYEHRPNREVSGHSVPWTALYTRSPIDLDKVNEHVAIEAERLWGVGDVLEEIK